MVNKSVAWPDKKVCICSQSTPLCAARSFRASAAVGERGWWLVCCTGDLGDSEGGLEKENKFITLPYLHITPQRPVNEDSGEMSGPHPLLRKKKVIRRSPGVNMSFTILTPWPLTSNSLGSVLHSTSFKTVCVALPLAKHQLSCFLPNSISWFLSAYLCRLQGWCDGKWLQMSPF